MDTAPPEFVTEVPGALSGERTPCKREDLFTGRDVDDCPPSL